MATEIQRNLQAFKQVWKSITGVPSVNFAEKRYTGVKYDADGTLVQAGAGDLIIGVLEEPNDIGEPAQVVAQGFMFIKLGAAVTTGTQVMTNASGEFVPYVAGADAYAAGIAAVGGPSGAIGTILLK